MQTTLRQLWFILSFCVVIMHMTSCNSDVNEVAIWDTVTLDFEGPELSETGTPNPFMAYDLKVEFSNGEKKYLVLGYFAADGNAAETGATSGNIWRVKFSPDQLGEWSYIANLVQVSNDFNRSTITNDSGKFKVVDGDFAESDFRYHGKLKLRSGVRYPQFAGSNEYFIKGGTNSPENLLAYADFDGTFDNDNDSPFLHHYSPHIDDWNEGEPSWQNGKGKGIIGGLNYLSSKGVNAIYFLTMNIDGDGNDVWPYIDPSTYDRFDCSKLDQWDIVFSHAQKLGIMIHMVTQETENETLLDNGNTDEMRQLYYKELIARFAHYPAVIWNIGEENGPADFSPEGQTILQQENMVKYIKENDPYDNLVCVHTHSTPEMRDPILNPLLGNVDLDALSMQVGEPLRVHDDIIEWRDRSVRSGHPWITYLDEIGPYWQGVKPDVEEKSHDSIRKLALWGALMAGGAGVEWYFGYKHPHADLNCEDWRSRDIMWEHTNTAIQFFHDHLPFWRMEPKDELLSGEGFVLGQDETIFAVYLPYGGENSTFDITNFKDRNYSIFWFDPRNGGDLIIGTKIQIGDKLFLSNYPKSEPDNDWLCLIVITD